MNDEAKFMSVIFTLENLKRTMNELERLWQSEDDSGTTVLDEILIKHWPFRDNDPFFANKEVVKWADLAIIEIREKIKDLSKKQ